MREEEICQNKLNEYKTWLDNGYAVVFQHCRGRGKSTGECVPYIYEREDGLFLQNWIRQQPFYNGELYLCGGSYTSSVHFVTAPFADDIKGAVLQVQDCERYNCNYHNGFYKIGLHGGWYVGMYKKKSIPNKNYTNESYNMLPLSDFSKTVFGEIAEDFDEILRHPNKTDTFWKTRYGGGEAHNAIKHANIPILLVTGFYDIYTGGIFDMWNSLDSETKSKSAFAVHPFDHGCNGDGQPISFENGNIYKEFVNFSVEWLNSVRGKCEPPFPKGKVTYYTVKQQLQCIDGNYFMETPKNGKKRTILPAPIVLDALRKELQKQKAEKVVAGKLWDNRFNLVFTDALGKNLVRRTVVKHFKKIIQRAEISDDARFHDLRHSFAITSLHAGDDIKTVQANLGHATAQFTLDTYGHVTQKMRQDSANRMQHFYEQLSK